jgi:hypothetical protein
MLESYVGEVGNNIQALNVEEGSVDLEGISAQTVKQFKLIWWRVSETLTP